MEHDDGGPPPTFDGYADFYRNSAYAEFEQEHRSGGSFGLSMIDVEQPAIDLVDAAVPEFVFLRCLTADLDALIDMGDRARHNRVVAPNTINVVPPFTETRFQVSGAHRLQVLTIPVGTMSRMTDETGLDSDAFASFYATPRQHERAARLQLRDVARE